MIPRCSYCGHEIKAKDHCILIKMEDGCFTADYYCNKECMALNVVDPTIFEE